MQKSSDNQQKQEIKPEMSFKCCEKCGKRNIPITKQTKNIRVCENCLNNIFY